MGCKVKIVSYIKFTKSMIVYIRFKFVSFKRDGKRKHYVKVIISVVCSHYVELYGDKIIMTQCIKIVS